MALGSLIGSAFVRISADTKPAEVAIEALGGIGKTVLSTTLLPAVAPVVVGVGAIAAAFLGAGAAAGALGAAVIPQFKQITAATQQQATAQAAQQKATVAQQQATAAAGKNGVAYENAVANATALRQRAQQLALSGSKGAAAAQKAAAEAALRAQQLAGAGGKEYAAALAKAKSASDAAKTAQAQYNDTLSGLPPATRQTAVAFAGLQDAFQKWSDGLSGSTMPIFTLGIEKVQGLLPKLSPIVRTAAADVKSFVENIGAGTGGQVFSKFGKDIGDLSGGSLTDFLNIGRNLAVGFAGILDAFTPMAAGVTGGLTTLTAKFADWGATAGSNGGVQAFFATAKEDGPKVGAAFEKIAAAATHVAGGLGPLTGIGLKVAEVLARILAALPVPVLNQVVNAIVAINLAMKAYAIVTAIAAAATWLFSTANGASRVQMLGLRIQMALVFVQLRLQALWTGLVTAAQWLWGTSLVSGTIALIASTASLIARNVAMAASATATGLVTAATWLWTAALGPAIAATWAMTVALLANPVTWVVIGIVALIAVIVLIATKTTWFQTAWHATWNFIKTTTSEVFDFLTHGFGQFAILILGPLAPIAFLALHWKETWNVIKTSAVDTWNFLEKWVIKPLASSFMWLWTNGIQPAIKFIVNGFLNMVGSILHGAVLMFGWIPGLGGKLKTAEKAFDHFADSVNKSLGGIKPKTVPVNIKFNGVDQGKITGHSYTSTTGFSYATGGAVRGPGTDTSDDIPSMLSDNEHVWTAKEVRAAGGHYAVSRLRKQVLKMAGYAAGGPVGPRGMAMSYTMPTDAGVQASTRSTEQQDIASVVKRIASSYATAYNKMISSMGGKIPTGQHLAVIRTAMAAAGVPPPGTAPQWLSGMNTLITRESGWNASAINRTDSNAKAGHPSQGLAQTIPGTFNHYVPSSLRSLGILNPVANVAAAIRYIVSRYGNITHVQQANANLPPQGYDSGGWLMPGRTLAVNNTGRPERVIGPREAAGVTVNLTIVNQGVLGSQRDVMNWLVASLQQAKREGRLRGIVPAGG